MQQATRLMEDFGPPVRHTLRDTYAMDERAIAWADPNIFKVFPLPVLAGTLDTALDQPGYAAVITHAMARKYFGRDLPLVGDTLQLQIGEHPAAARKSAPKPAERRPPGTPCGSPPC